MGIQQLFTRTQNELSQLEIKRLDDLRAVSLNEAGCSVADRINALQSLRDAIFLPQSDRNPSGINQRAVTLISGHIQDFTRLFIEDANSSIRFLAAKLIEEASPAALRGIDPNLYAVSELSLREKSYQLAGESDLNAEVVQELSLQLIDQVKDYTNSGRLAVLSFIDDMFAKLRVTHDEPVSCILADAISEKLAHLNEDIIISGIEIDQKKALKAFSRILGQEKAQELLVGMLDSMEGYSQHINIYRMLMSYLGTESGPSMIEDLQQRLNSLHDRKIQFADPIFKTLCQIGLAHPECRPQIIDFFHDMGMHSTSPAYALRSVSSLVAISNGLAAQALETTDQSQFSLLKAELCQKCVLLVSRSPNPETRNEAAAYLKSVQSELREEHIMGLIEALQYIEYDGMDTAYSLQALLSHGAVVPGRKSAEQNGRTCGAQARSICADLLGQFLIVDEKVNQFVLNALRWSAKNDQAESVRNKSAEILDARSLGFSDNATSHT